MEFIRKRVEESGMPQDWVDIEKLKQSEWMDTFWNIGCGNDGGGTVS
jgi:hypothetical protein